MFERDGSGRQKDPLRPYALSVLLTYNANLPSFKTDLNETEDSSPRSVFRVVRIRNPKIDLSGD
jgi:hypothetical protein